jgi:hypothetical protein
VTPEALDNFGLSILGPLEFDTACSSASAVFKGTLKGTRNCVLRLAATPGQPHNYARKL